MSQYTKIEWADHTFNPWIGRQAISPGCANCYAAAWAKRYGRNFADRTLTKTWAQPKLWNAQAEAFHAEHGRRQRVFCASLADVFDNEVPLEWRSELFMLISETPNLDWLILTKRIGNAAKMLPAWYQDPEAWEFGNGVAHPNVWLGATVVNQEEADRDIPKLLAVPAAKRFLSIEPMLAPISLRWLPAWPENAPSTAQSPSGTTDHLDGLRRLDWIIAGGESGPGARPSHPDWYRSLRDQCAAADVPFLFKQWGEWLPINQQEEEFTNRLYKSRRVAKLHEDQGNLDDIYGRRCIVDGTVVHMDGRTHGVTEPMAFLQGTTPMTTFKVGKKAAARLLDGIEHNGFPV